MLIEQFDGCQTATCSKYNKCESDTALNCPSPIESHHRNRSVPREANTQYDHDHRRHQSPHPCRRQWCPSLVAIITLMLCLAPLSYAVRHSDTPTYRTGRYNSYPQGNEDYPETGWQYHDPVAGPVITNDGWIMGPLKIIKCYSCMSLAYQDNWNSLKSIYKMPHSFTNRCNDPFDPSRMGTINCSSICITMKEPQIQGGMFIGYMHIRGCLDFVLEHGFNNSAIATHRFKQFDMCRTLPRQHLFAHDPDEGRHSGLMLMGDVTMCACYGDKCNGSGSASALRPSAWQVLMIMALLASLWSRGVY